METYAIANILYNMSLDMDYMDSQEHWETEIDLIKIKLEKLKENDSILYYVLEAIAFNNTNYLDLLTK